VNYLVGIFLQLLLLRDARSFTRQILYPSTNTEYRCAISSRPIRSASFVEGFRDALYDLKPIGVMHWVGCWW